jgi:hypothetical protein
MVTCIISTCYLTRGSRISTVKRCEYTIIYKNKAACNQRVMKSLDPNIIDDDLQQTTKFSSEDVDTNKILQPINKIYFVICNSCYWCASYFGIDDLESISGSSSRVLDCHICNSHNTELMPISNDESFRIGYSQTKGMEMEFYRNNNIVDRQQFAKT